MTATDSITIEGSVNNCVTRPASQYRTGADILRDHDLLTFLGIGENVELVRNSISVDSGEAVHAGDRWSFRTKANTKGA